MTLTQRVQRLLGTGVEETGRGQGLYACGRCNRRFECNRQQCPECGSYVIERTTYDDLLLAD